MPLNRRVERQPELAAGTAADAPKISRDNPVPLPPFWGRRVVKDLSAKHLFPYINPDALFVQQWGFKKGASSETEHERLLDDKVRPLFEELKLPQIESFSEK